MMRARNGDGECVFDARRRAAQSVRRLRLSGVRAIGWQQWPIPVAKPTTTGDQVVAGERHPSISGTCRI